MVYDHFPFLIVIHIYICLFIYVYTFILYKYRAGEKPLWSLTNRDQQRRKDSALEFPFHLHLTTAGGTHQHRPGGGGAAEGVQELRIQIVPWERRSHGNLCMLDYNEYILYEYSEILGHMFYIICIHNILCIYMWHNIHMIIWHKSMYINQWKLGGKQSRTGIAIRIHAQQN